MGYYEAQCGLEYSDEIPIKCALICVDVVLNEYSNKVCRTLSIKQIERIVFYRKVKTEIEKLWY